MITNAAGIDLIDERIRAAQSKERAFGTVATVSSSALRATVTFDGSSLAVPVKVFGGVDPAAGDRVTLDRYGSDWVITGTFALRYLDQQGVNGQAPTDTTTAGLFETYAGDPSFQWTKRWDATRTRCEAHAAMYSTVNSTTVAIGMRFTNNATAVSVDQHIVHWYWTVAFEHTQCSGVVFMPAASLGAGSYTVYPLWARIGGTGVISTNSDDWYSFAATEIGP